MLVDLALFVEVRKSVLNPISQCLNNIIYAGVAKRVHQNECYSGNGTAADLTKVISATGSRSLTVL